MIQHSRSASWLPATRRLPEPERKRILVTGGAGFVGSHLVDRLLLMGHDVIVMDSFLTGARSNLEQWEGHRSFELLRHDVIEPILVEVDQIYHLACPASPRHYQANPIKTLKTNFLGTSNMLGLAKRTKSTLLLASTSEVYGDPQINPQREDYCGNTSCVGPRAAYDEGKRVAETLTNEYMKKDGVDTRIARIFNTYGPRMHAADGRVVSNFVIQALKGLPLTVYGDGIQTRSFCFIHDLIDGLIALMNVHPGEEGKDIHFPVNLGSSFEFTIAELATIVAEVVDELLAEERPNTEIRYLPLPIDDPKQRRPDTTRAEGLIGWNPRWKLKDGLREMAAYYHARILDGSL
ncbi:NAD(P)-binding protein [Ceraceosorus guamensis]|uniref:UDP-glucuronic acid decarboxylase 1 n=1 Tax=Ceraceosorus guamensis TaxID=1522189 RepID=A0A316W041_9BASI|nr:NAD(P)-binding protein [Ceraceosorus guamensis]PWN42073.1 NAD(P)-binding protein [Ceraceosorus guamensis]